MSNLPDELGRLSTAEKLDLLDALWESIESDPPLTDAQRTELDRRIAHHEQHPADVLPWEQVRADMLGPQ